MSTLVYEEELFKATDFKSRSALERWLNSHGVAWWPGRNGRIVTTAEALNRALLAKNEVREIRFGKAA